MKKQEIIKVKKNWEQPKIKSELLIQETLGVSGASVDSNGGSK